MVHLYQNKNMKTLIVSVFKELTRPHGVNISNIACGILDHLFQIVDTEDIPIKQVIPCFAALSEKSENDIAKIIKKPHNFVWKTKSYLKKTQVTLRSYIQISQQKDKKKGSRACGCFLPKSRYHGIYFKKLFQKSKLSFNNGVFLKYTIILELGEMSVLIICLK